MTTPTASHRTKIVATLGPASWSPDILRALVRAGMSIARLNFSHGDLATHARTIAELRAIALELDTPVTILQDVQGPKIRVAQLPHGSLTLATDEKVTLVPLAEYHELPGTIPIDYDGLAADVAVGASVLLDDGLLELRVESIADLAVGCRVVEGGLLQSRKGVVLPNTYLRIPSLTEKDRRDLTFGIAHDVDWIALSFVRNATDVHSLKELIADYGTAIPVMAKIETPHAVDNLNEILDAADGLMVARGDLGVEMSPEKVPMTQKKIIHACNRRGKPVVTATQMLESMIREPRPTRAEAGDVANAIIDGSDAVMLSGETSVGRFPLKAVEMMARIAREVEPSVKFVDHPPAQNDQTNALSQAIRAIDRTLPLRCIAAFTSDGYTARMVSAERPRALVAALTPHKRTFHALNLHWGVKPLIIPHDSTTFEELLGVAESALCAKRLASPGDRVLIVAGLPMGKTGSTNLVKIHTIGSAAAVSN